jgi:hypothetical protein
MGFNYANHPNDEVQTIMLTFLHDQHQSASSRQGKRGAMVTISELRRQLKIRFRLHHKAVHSNLHYLVDNGLVLKESVPTWVKTPRGGRAVPGTEYFGISAAGIDALDGPGKFSRPQEKEIGTINIHNSTNAVVNAGNGNHVVLEQRDNSAFASLRAAIEQASDVDRESKLEAIAYVDTIRVQLSSPRPSVSIIQTAWNRIQSLATIASLTASVLAVAKSIGPFLR